MTLTSEKENNNTLIVFLQSAQMITKQNIHLLSVHKKGQKRPLSNTIMSSLYLPDI